ncbi:SOS response-associated peptidase [Microlunatus panaciterrae]|uniref:Abasic site processing protein n=1 Tax=Microlunatus panaciterrae TaxID=400768 RepID=A0ABS2REK7_9ACTN|nr:SOS response-associated peptidase [Microlunatus panaciterrae]MBM7797436.1 putative SOS response-associated peptidase YedK [Microlunatus panaciterrae]
MCGRYAASADPDKLVEEFDVDEVTGEIPGPHFNIAPTDSVPAVLERRRSDTGEVTRRLSPLTWGLVPSWAKDRSIGSKMINARFESVAEKPAFRKAFAARRCLLPADGYYEWYTLESPADGPKGKPRKQPFFVHRSDGGLLAMAGLYEIWRDPSKDRDDDSAWLRTCTVITTTATDAVGHIHDRMPMVVAPEAYNRWLDPNLTDPDAALELLAVTEAESLEAYAVSTEVNSVRNDGPQLVEPLATDQDSGEQSAETLF